MNRSVLNGALTIKATLPENQEIELSIFLGWSMVDSLGEGPWFMVAVMAAH
jgi:hypothetical protein